MKSLHSEKEETVLFNKILRRIFILAFITTVLISVNVAADQVITDGLVSYWSFNEGSIVGKTVKDVFGANHGTIDGDVEAAKGGKFGQALRFDGGHVDCGANKSLIEIGDQMTLELWLKADKPGWAIIAGVSKSGSNSYVTAWHPDPRIDFNLWNGNKETWPFHSAAKLTIKDWYHVACVYDGSEAIIYVNGKIDNKKKFEGELKHNGVNFWMGARKSDGLPYFGLVDELRLYKRGLSQAEVKKNMVAEGLAVQPAQKLALTWGKMKVAK